MTAILCAGAPESVPFMADETMDSVPGLGTIAYTIPYYLKFATKVIEKAALLKSKGSLKVNTPHTVEMALWTEYMLNKYNVPHEAVAAVATSGPVSGSPSTAKRPSSKRKAEAEAEPEAAQETDTKPVGKQRSVASAKITKPASSSSAPSTRSSTRSTRSKLQ